MKVMVVTFGFEGLSADEVAAVSEDLAPQFAEIPGCLEKTWLLDREAGRCGGVYKFADESSLRAYRNSELWAGVQANDVFNGFEVAEYDMIEAATAITGGVPSGALAG